MPYDDLEVPALIVDRDYRLYTKKPENDQLKKRIQKYADEIHRLLETTHKDMSREPRHAASQRSGTCQEPAPRDSVDIQRRDRAAGSSHRGNRNARIDSLKYQLLKCCSDYYQVVPSTSEGEQVFLESVLWCARRYDPSRSLDPGTGFHRLLRNHFKNLMRRANDERGKRERNEEPIDGIADDRNADVSYQWDYEAQLERIEQARRDHEAEAASVFLEMATVVTNFKAHLPDKAHSEHDKLLQGMCFTDCLTNIIHGQSNFRSIEYLEWHGSEAFKAMEVAFLDLFMEKECASLADIWNYDVLPAYEYWKRNEDRSTQTIPKTAWRVRTEAYSDYLKKAEGNGMAKPAISAKRNGFLTQLLDDARICKVVTAFGYHVVENKTNNGTFLETIESSDYVIEEEERVTNGKQGAVTEHTLWAYKWEIKHKQRKKKPESHRSDEGEKPTPRYMASDEVEDFPTRAFHDRAIASKLSGIADTLSREIHGTPGEGHRLISRLQKLSGLKSKEAERQTFVSDVRSLVTFWPSDLAAQGYMPANLDMLGFFVDGLVGLAERLISEERMSCSNGEDPDNARWAARACAQAVLDVWEHRNRLPEGNRLINHPINHEMLEKSAERALLVLVSILQSDGEMDFDTAKQGMQPIFEPITVVEESLMPSAERQSETRALVGSALDGVGKALRELLSRYFESESLNGSEGYQGSSLGCLRLEADYGEPVAAALLGNALAGLFGGYQYWAAAERYLLAARAAGVGDVEGLVVMYDNGVSGDCRVNKLYDPCPERAFEASSTLTDSSLDEALFIRARYLLEGAYCKQDANAGRKILKLLVMRDYLPAYSLLAEDLMDAKRSQRKKAAEILWRGRLLGDDKCCAIIEERKVEVPRLRVMYRAKQSNTD